MSIPILTAVGDPRWEADLTTGLSTEDHGVHVVRRCVDLADLLATSATGQARAVVLSADLRRLDREALSRLALSRVAVVGLTAAGDEPAERRLRQLGVTQVLPHDASSQVVSAAVVAAVEALATAGPASVETDWADPARALPTAGSAEVSELVGLVESPPPVVGSGQLIAVWGPAGAPGRSTIAVNLAAELCGLGHSTLLVDADSYGGVVGQLLGLLDEAPGVAGACRLANSGSLDLPRLADLAIELRPGLSVLTGITRAERWLELRPGGLELVLELARSLAAVTVVDCGFCLEQDEELSYDTAAPRRNGATLAALGAADLVVGVASADPVGLARYVRAVPDCTAASTTAPLTVVNRVRRHVAGPGDPRREVARALRRYAGITDVKVVPEDGEALDVALATGRTLNECAPRSPARLAIRDLVGHVTGAAPARTRGRRAKRAGR